MNDLISRQAAIDDFYKYPNVKWTTLDVLEHINALPSAEPKWIPVTERLPEANEKDENGFVKAYLVQDARWMDVARWDGEYWVAWGYGIVLKNVTAWMPLPEPWKGEADA